MAAIYGDSERKKNILKKLDEIVNGKKMLKSDLAKLKAQEWHRAVNHLYDGKDYFDTHLNPVAEIGKKYLYLLPESVKEDVLCGLYLHDSIEDARVTFNDLQKIFGEIVAELVYACTNDKGKTRAERAGPKYYKGIRNTPYATFIKICDRMGNVTHSKETGSRMFDVYKKELDKFLESLKGRDTLWGKIRYWYKTKFNLWEADYDIMYDDYLKLFLTPEELEWFAAAENLLYRIKNEPNSFDVNHPSYNPGYKPKTK